MYSKVVFFVLLYLYTIAAIESESYSTPYFWDCAGVLNGDAVIDACGKCGGDNSTCTDCMGVVNGGRLLDECGVCGGDGTTCCSNYLQVENKLWNFILLPATLSDTIGKLEKSSQVLSWIDTNLPEENFFYDEFQDLYNLGAVVEINRMFLQRCLAPLCENSVQFRTQLAEEIGNVGIQQRAFFHNWQT